MTEADVHALISNLHHEFAAAARVRAASSAVPDVHRAREERHRALSDTAMARARELGYAPVVAMGPAPVAAEPHWFWSDRH